MKHIALVPLIGGLSLGAEEVLGQPAEAIVSYSAFAGNEAFFQQYNQKRGVTMPRYEIDNDTIPEFKDIDVVTSVCPCSGLSAANQQAGAGCQQNRWMVDSTKWALENIKPKALIGENAPNLATNAGRPIAHELRDIAEANGYRLQLVKTTTRYHGIPQDRTRSFFIIMREDIGSFHIKREVNESEQTWLEFLDSFEQESIEPVERCEFSEAAWELAKACSGTDDDGLIRMLIEKGESSLGICVRDTTGAAVALVEKHLEDESDVPKSRLARKIVHAKGKLADGKNYMDSFVRFNTRAYYPSVMWRHLQIHWHPRKRTPLGPREMMRLMGLPEDMDVPRNHNAICQNVPTCTAAWAVGEVVAALNGEREPWDGEGSNDGILRYNNKNGKNFK